MAGMLNSDDSQLQAGLRTYGPDEQMIQMRRLSWNLLCQEGETRRSFWLADTDADEEGR